MPVAPALAKDNPLYASIVIDSDTGEVLSESGADKSLHPASLTKIMTLFMLFEAIEAGKVKASDSISISDHAASMPPSNIGLAPGSSIKVKDAISALVTKSANDIAAAVAEHLGGSERNFGRMMTARARELGMTHSYFVNASGLHHPQQISSARDMAILARIIITHYPAYYRSFSLASFTYRGRTYPNHNHLMKTYRGMDGMKTGFIRQSGFNLVASATRKDRRVIGVVFGGRTANSRNEHMASLLDAGFSQLGRGGAAGRIAAYTPPAPESIAAPAAQQIAAAEPSAPPPVPPRKPGILVAYDTLNKISNTYVTEVAEVGKTPVSAEIEAEANASYSDSAEVMNIASLSQGDAADPPAIQEGAKPAAKTSLPVPVSLPPQDKSGAWSIQVGAFSSRAATDKRIQDSLKKLPAPYRQASPTIAPLKTAGGWVFRGRIGGYSKEQADSACRYLTECITVAPQ